MGKRVSWVELYLDLVFVLAVAQLANLIVAEPEMSSVWIALGLFWTLWWTWVGFAVVYNRHGGDTRTQRLAFLAGSVPAGVAAVAIEPASTGDSAVFALSLAAIRLVLAGVYVINAGRDDRLVRAYLVSAALFVISVWVPEPFRYLLWAIGIGLESGAMLADDRKSAADALEPPPLRRAVRPVPDHPAGRGGRGGRPRIRRPRGLGGARRRDADRGGAVVALRRLGGGAQPQGARAAALGDDGAGHLRRRSHAPGVRAAHHGRGHRSAAGGRSAADRLLAGVRRDRFYLGTRAIRGRGRIPTYARVLVLVATFQLARLGPELGPYGYVWLLTVWLLACAALTTGTSPSDAELQRLVDGRQTVRRR